MGDSFINNNNEMSVDFPQFSKIEFYVFQTVTYRIGFYI
jgi:hypothetical protein